jgi:6-phosphogluconolactonase (cycloisomerase 2 family)
MNFSFKVANFPRHFAVTPENMIFVACQKANLIQKYLVSQEKILLLSEVQIKTPSVILILDK